MRRATKAKRSLQLVLLGALALAAIAGGYLIFRYPAIMPPFHHEDKLKAPQTLTAALSGDTSQPLAAQSAQPNSPVTVNPTSVEPSISSPALRTAATPSTTGIAIPTNLIAPAPLPDGQLQAGSAVIGSLQSLTNQVQTTAKSLFGSLTNL